MGRKRKTIGRTGNPRQSYGFYGLDRQRVKELQSYCVSGKYPLKMLQEACTGFEWLSPWIILSVTKSKPFDRLQILWELGEIERPAIGKTDFYGYRRRFFANLDVILREIAADTMGNSEVFL